MRLSWPHVSKRKSFALKDGKMGLPEHRLDIPTPREPILLSSKGDESRISKPLPKAAQQAEKKRNSVFGTRA